MPSFRVTVIGKQSNEGVNESTEILKSVEAALFSESQLGSKLMEQTQSRD